MRRTRTYITLGAYFLGVGTLISCGTSEGHIPDEATTPAVEALQARYGALPLRERLTGTVYAAGQVSIYPEVSGPVVAVLAENGDRVSAGDPLVRIRAQTSRSQLQQSEAGVTSAEAEVRRARAALDDLDRRFTRAEQLVRDEFISQEEFERIQTNRTTAQADLARAEAQASMAAGQLGESRESVRQTTVRAPIDGTVGRRNAELGMFVNGSTALFTIGRLESMQIDVPVTQEMLSRIRIGQTAEIRSESLPDTVIVAAVSRISPFIEPGSFSAEAEIDVENADGVLLPGMFVTVDILYGESEQATLVPKSAIYDDPATGFSGVYVAPALGLEIEPVAAEGDEPATLTAPTPAEFRRVDVLAEGRHVVGVAGLDPDSWVVVVGQHLLASQDPTTGPPRARVRTVTWDHLLTLQGLQREDLLRQFMEKQQRIARSRLDSTSTANGED